MEQKFLFMPRQYADVVRVISLSTGTIQIIIIISLYVTEIALKFSRVSNTMFFFFLFVITRNDKLFMSIYHFCPTRNNKIFTNFPEKDETFYYLHVKSIAM